MILEDSIMKTFLYYLSNQSHQNVGVPVGTYARCVEVFMLTNNSLVLRVSLFSNKKMVNGSFDFQKYLGKFGCHFFWCTLIIRKFLA